MAGMLPVILCGQTTKIAVGVIAALKPEIDGIRSFPITVVESANYGGFLVIHLCLTSDSGKAEIPAILKGEPVTTDVELGSKNYQNIPKVIVLGGGYNDEDVNVMRKACQAAKTPLVPWLRVRNTSYYIFLLSIIDVSSPDVLKIARS